MKLVLAISVQRSYTAKNGTDLFQLIICRLVTTCLNNFSKLVDNKLGETTCNRSAGNLQQTCRQQAVASHANVSWYRLVVTSCCKICQQACCKLLVAGHVDDECHLSVWTQKSTHRFTCSINVVLTSRKVTLMPYEFSIFFQRWFDVVKAILNVSSIFNQVNMILAAR